jgi:hypothetical protein
MKTPVVLQIFYQLLLTSSSGGQQMIVVYISNGNFIIKYEYSITHGQFSGPLDIAIDTSAIVVYR